MSSSRLYLSMQGIRHNMHYKLFTYVCLVVLCRAL